MSSEQRVAIYTAAAAVLSAMATFGWINAEQEGMLAVAIGSTLTALSQILNIVKTWKQRHDAEDFELSVEALNQIDRIVGNETVLDADETARVRGILLNGPAD